MRFWVGVFIFMAAIVGFLSDWQPASARTLTASGKITITAVVLPAHYVIVDRSGDILRVESNTTEDVTPRVFLEKVSRGNELPLSSDIYKQYRKHVPAGKSKVGIVYQKSVFLAQGGKMLPDLISTDNL